MAAAGCTGGGPCGADGSRAASGCLQEGLRVQVAQELRVIGVAAVPHRAQAQEKALVLCRALLDAGCEVVLGPDTEDIRRELPEAGVRCCDLAGLAHADLIVSLGGDGTLLALACHAGPQGTPLLGVDLGSFGFLASEDFEEVMRRLEDLLAGRIVTDDRLMVTAQVRRGEETVSHHCGLNEVVIGRTDVRRPVRLCTWVNGEVIANYRADGLIISTPTGCTAYTLSAGGPVVSPAVEALVITPICPHTLYSRPLVVEAGAVVEVKATSGNGPASGITLILDGQDQVDLEQADRVVVQRASFRARLVRLSEEGFYQRLRKKLNWGAER